MNKLLLLPSARLVPAELRVDFGEIPSGMIPLNSLPALHHIAQPYAAAGYDVVIAVHERARAIEEYVARCPGLRARTVDVGATGLIGETVATALHRLREMPAQLVINFADTLLDDLVPAADAVCFSEVEELFRWTAFEADERGVIERVFEKNQLKPAPAGRVFVGAFGISDPGRFLGILDRCLRRADAPVDPFWRAVVEYHNTLPPERRLLRQVADWRDFGHLDTYYATQRSIFLNQRYFNSVSVDLGRGVLRKASAHSEKLAREIEWYLALPAELQYLGPRVFGYRKDPGETSAEMEFYGYPALNDVYLHGAWDPGVWGQVLGAIGRAIDGMRQYKQPAGAKARREALRSMYQAKTVERLGPILTDRRFRVFTEGTVRINGRECMGLGRCLAVLPEVMERSGVSDPPEFTIIHGDLCLSNVLYDRRSGFVRLVDPRGSFGASGIFGDPRYDLAKLSHSFHGDYDFYVNGLFGLEVSEDGVECRPFRSPLHETVRQMFDHWLLRRERAHYRAIRLIESLLFLSMAPLHADRPRSQLAFLARGLELFDRAVRTAAAPSIEVSSDAGSHDEHYYYDGR